MSLKKNLVLIYLVFFSRAAVFFLLLPLLIRRLGEGWGQVAIALSFVQLATTVLEFGFGVSATKSIAKNRSSVDYLYQIVRSVISIQFMLFLLVALIGIPLIYLPVVQQIDYYLIIVLIVLFQGLSPLWFLRGVEDMLLISISEVLSKALVLLVVYFFVMNESDVVIVYLSYFIGALIPVLVCYPYIFKRYLRGANSLLSLALVMKQIKQASVFFGVRLSAMFLSVGGSLALGAMGHIKLAGMYAIAERILAGIRSLLAPAWDVLFPKLLSILVKDNKQADIFRAKVNIYMTLFSLLVSVLLLITAPWLVQYFSGGKDESIILLVQIMFLGPFFATVTNSLGLNYLVSHEKDVSFLMSFLLGSIFYAVLVVYIALFGNAQESLNMIAYGYAISLAITMMMVIYFVKKPKQL